MSFTSGYPSVGFPLPWLANDSSPQALVGSVIQGNDNTEYVYVKAGAADLAAGVLYQAPAEATTHENLAVVAAPVGQTFITTTTTLTLTANQYAGGYVIVAVTPGLANKYQISSHPAVTGAVVTLTLVDPILVALTTATRIDLVPEPANGVIVQSVSGAFTGAPVGFGTAPVTAGNYGWLQIKGLGAVKNDAAGALTVGQDLAPSASVAGAVRLATAGIPSVAIAAEGIASGEVGGAIIKLS